MKVIYGIGQVKKFVKRPIVVIGVFDGLHRGHHTLIRQAIQRARTLKTKIVVLTFVPHPIGVLHPKRYLPLLISVHHRIRLMEDMGVDQCIILKFTKRFSRLSPQAFVQKYLVKVLNPVEIFVGDDFRFGKNRRGTLETFSKVAARYGFRVRGIRCVGSQKKKIGSSRIRELIAKGCLRQAQNLLGRPFSIMGRVIKGYARGKKLGYPTANISVLHKVVPPQGAYAVRVIVGKKIYFGMANIGYRPTFRHKAPLNIEVHIFRFKKDLYGREIIVEFLKRIRGERTFNSLEGLKKQLQKDEKKIKNFFSAPK